MHINALARGAAAVVFGASAGLALAAPVWATDPPGANGTVKIDGREFDEDINNEPHVTCEFRVKFFDFDSDEHGNIIFTAQAPSGDRTLVLLREDDKLLSDDAATGAANDPDEIYTYTSNDLDLSGLEPHDKQGYHIKLTVEQPGAPGMAKHKVFWLQPCVSTTSPTTPSSPTTPPSTPPTSPSTGGVGHEGGNGGLPVTGAAASTAAAVGLGLIGGGAALMIRRRRRFTA